jgi:hypothetical protein
MTDLIERLRAVKWEVTDDCGRMPDDPTHKCVFVDMRPAEFQALLREAADALEAARVEREALLDALRQIAEWPDGGNRYGQEKIKRFAQHTIDAAIDQARGKGVAGGA